MTDQIMMLLAVMLAGAAAAGLVAGPPARLARLAPTGTGAPAVRVRAAPWLRARADAAPPGQRIGAGVAAGSVTVLVWQAMQLGPAAVGLLLGALVAATMIVALGQLETTAAKRRRLQMITDLPQILELLAAAMRAGLPLRGAVREVVRVADGPLAEDLATVVKNVDLGRGETEAWRDLRDHPALGRVSIDLARSVESGTMVVQTLRRHARIARRDRRGMLEAQAKTVGVKSVPALMLCLVPSFLLISIVPSAVTAFQGLIF